jgi:hypothetical protein
LLEKRAQPRSLMGVVDLKVERGERFYDLVKKVASPFAERAVPTANVYGPAYDELIGGLKVLYAELEPLWEHLKAGSTGYITSAAILSHPTFAPSRTAIGLLSSRVGDAARRQEWLFGSTGAGDPIIYATLHHGVQRNLASRRARDAAS